MQTTFLRALGALNRGERPRAERAWLLTIARNVCASRATSAASRHELLDPRALEAATAAAGPEDHDVDIAAALRALPEGQRRAFVLRAVHELSYDEIAAELDVSRAAVESWIFRARRKLASTVGERRRRLALDLSSAASAAKSLVAANAVKVAAVTVAAGTALTLGPATPDRSRGAPPSQVEPPREDTPLPREPRTSRTSEPGAQRTREPRADAREETLPAVGPAPVPAPTAAPVAETASAADVPLGPAAPAPAPADASGVVVEIALPDVPLLEEPVLELPALDPPELARLLPPLVPELDPAALVPGLPALP